MDTELAHIAQSSISYLIQNGIMEADDNEPLNFSICYVSHTRIVVRTAALPFIFPSFVIPISQCESGLR